MYAYNKRFYRIAKANIDAIFKLLIIMYAVRDDFSSKIDVSKRMSLSILLKTLYLTYKADYRCEFDMMDQT